LDARRAEFLRWAGLLGGALAWRLLLFSGPNGSDDLAYSDAAARLAAGGGLTPSIHGLRLGYVGPLAAVYALFGIGSFGLVVFNLAASVADVALARLLARTWLDDAGAWIAAALVALLPLHVFHATEAHPDLPLAALLSLSAWLLLRSIAHDRALLYAAVGAALGAAHLVKESAFLAFAALTALAGRPRPKLLWVPAVFAAVVLLEAAFFAVATGDPLFRVSTVRSIQPGALAALAAGPGPLEAAATFFWPGSAMFTAYGLLALLAAGGAGLAVGRRELRAPVLWAAALLVLPAVWPLSLSPYRPAMLAYPRIFLPAAAPLAILAAAVLRRLPRQAFVAAAVLTAAVALPSAVLLRTDARQLSAGARLAHAALGRQDVLTDPRTAGLLRLYDGGPGRRLVADWSDPPPARPHVRLYNGTWLRNLKRWYGQEPPEGFFPGGPPFLDAEVGGRLRLRPLFAGRVERSAGDALRAWRVDP
jgi:4-amino-4-deoxy-L-arabinose transferase-like glycosyltransferase